jgi:uncharacterized cupin superfamily protein
MTPDELPRTHTVASQHDEGVSDMSLAHVSNLDPVDLEPMTSEEGGWVPLEGDAQARQRTLRETESIWSGIATVQPCSFSYTPEHAGAIQILDGTASMTYDGTQHELSAGSVVYLEPGAVTTWVVHTPIKEFFLAALR